MRDDQAIQPAAAVADRAGTSRGLNVPRQDISTGPKPRFGRRMERAAEDIVRDATRRIGWIERIRGLLAGWRRRIRSTVAGRITLKVVVGLLGAAIVLLGVVMIPLPGPGWLVVFAGLAILSVEYVWAKHLLRYGRDKVRVWTRWVGRQSWWMRMAIGALGLIFVAAAAWLAVRNSFGVDVAQNLWRFLTSR